MAKVTERTLGGVQAMTGTYSRDMNEFLRELNSEKPSEKIVDLARKLEERGELAPGSTRDVFALYIAYLIQSVVPSKELGKDGGRTHATR
ncbi:MAG TPA: hypothetical protein VNI20_08560 [Fimbriimonadaceae bacterium]|nr:hypothetical protein [Fimbriimonadaceae bacterium]